jgi:hypothetical protein
MGGETNFSFFYKIIPPPPLVKLYFCSSDYIIIKKEKVHMYRFPVYMSKELGHGWTVGGGGGYSLLPILRSY